MTRISRLLLAASLFFASGGARAAELTDIGTAFEATKPYDVRLSMAYSHIEKVGQLKRELTGTGLTQDRALLLKDFAFRQRRELLTLRAEAGVFTDVALHLELPIVIQQQTSFDYDQAAGDDCVYPPAMNPTCVNASNSTTVADAIVPTTSVPFRGASRGGSGASALDTINFGATWAPIHQKRDASKPTWILGIDARVSIGNIQRFDRNKPSENRAVSDGVHRIVFHSALSRRVGRLEPYFSVWYMHTIARGDSLFIDYGAAQAIKDPQTRAGGSFGLEAHVYEHEPRNLRLRLDLRGRIEGTFAGRGYSEAWELFASSPALVCDPSFNPACDATLLKNPYQGQAFTGLTAIDGYVSASVDLTLLAQLGRITRARLGFRYTHDQAHLITNDSMGVPSRTTERISTAADYNPAWRQVIDQPGRRYKVDNVNTYELMLAVQARF